MTQFGRAAVKGILHTKGTKLVNGEEEEIILEGYGVGNWMNPEGFMIGVPSMVDKETMDKAISEGKRLPAQPFDRRRSVDAVVRELCGEAYAASFWERWYTNHLSREDIKAMAELDLNSVRLVLNSAVLLEEGPGIHWKEDGFRLIEQALDWCEEYGIYAILDLHAAPGGQAGGDFDDGYDSMPRLFYDEECWNRGLLLWEELAKRFGNRWIVGAYDLLNEPLSIPFDWKVLPKLKQFYDEAIAIIRKHDKQHLFTLEGHSFARGISIFDHDYDPECHNWCIHLHRYHPSPEKRELYPYLLKGLAYNVPIWIGEGGADPENNAVFYNIAKDYGIGYCLWCWKTAADPNHAPRCVHHILPKEWNLILDYCRNGSKPSYEKAITIFDEYLENMKYEHCIKDFRAIQKSRRKAPFDLPAVGYDNLPGEGESFCGHWEYGNLLNYRLEDHTKLVWDNHYDVPTLWIDGVQTEAPKEPLQCLLLELSAGEFATYTIREVPAGCSLVLEAVCPKASQVSVSLDGKKLDTVSFAASPSNDYIKSKPISLPEGNGGKIKLVLQSGLLQLKVLHFQVANDQT